MYMHKIVVPCYEKFTAPDLSHDFFKICIHVSNNAPFMYVLVDFKQCIYIKTFYFVLVTECKHWIWCDIREANHTSRIPGRTITRM